MGAVLLSGCVHDGGMMWASYQGCTCYSRIATGHFGLIRHCLLQSQRYWADMSAFKDQCCRFCWQFIASGWFGVPIPYIVPTSSGSLSLRPECFDSFTGICKVFFRFPSILFRFVSLPMN